MNYQQPTYQELMQKIQTLEAELRQMKTDAGAAYNRYIQNGLTELGIGVVIIDQNHTILFQNSVVKSIWGDNETKSCDESCLYQTKSCQSCPFFLAFHEDRTVSRVTRAIDGKDYEIISAPLPQNGEAIKKIIGLFFDKNLRNKSDMEQRQLEARLQRAEKLESIGVMAGGVAHDLNNILAALVGYPDILLNELPVDSPHRDAKKERREK